MTDPRALDLRDLLNEFMAAEQCSSDAAQFFAVLAAQYLGLPTLAPLLDRLDAIAAETRAMSHGVGIPRARILRILAEGGSLSRAPLGRAALATVIASPLTHPQPQEH